MRARESTGPKGGKRRVIPGKTGKSPGPHGPHTGPSDMDTVVPPTDCPLPARARECPEEPSGPGHPAAEGGNCTQAWPSASTLSPAFRSTSYKLRSPLAAAEPLRAPEPSPMKQKGHQMCRNSLKVSAGRRTHSCPTREDPPRSPRGQLPALCPRPTEATVEDGIVGLDALSWDGAAVGRPHCAGLVPLPSFPG